MNSAVFSLTGDVESIRSSASTWSAFATAASTASADIRRIDSGDFRGDEADLYRDRLDHDLPPHLDTTSKAWSSVSAALQTYATTLETLQGCMSGLAVEAADQQSRLNSAHDAMKGAQAADARHAASVAEQNTAGQAQPDAYRAQSSGAATNLTKANAALQATIDAGNQVRAEHDSAVDTCVRAIDDAARLRFEEPPGFWGRLGNAIGGWIRDHADVLTAISAVLKQISSIAGLLAMIPILAPVMGPIAAASGAGALVIDGAVMAATGKGSVTDLMVDAAGLIPGARAGGELARGAEAAVGATRSATAVAREASGVRTVATDVRSVTTGVDRTGSRAADGAENAVRHDTPADDLPCAGDPIHVVTGQMILQQTDLELPGVLPVILKRVYLSSYRWGRAFGPSWASTLDQRVEIGTDGGACFVAEDGVVLYYPGAAAAPDGVAFWPSEGMQRWPLRRIVGGGWTVEDPDRRIVRRFAAPDADDCCVLLEIVDGHGNSITFDHAADGQVSGVRHSAGYEIEVRSSDSLVAGLVVGGEADAVVSFGYDLHGNMLQVSNSDCQPLQFDWEHGRIVGWRDRNDIWYRYVYDEDGRCVRTAGRGRVLSYGFSYLPGRTLVTDSLGGVTTYEYNQAHQLTRQTDPLGGVTTSLWDRYDHLLLRTDPLGRSTQFRYDDAGRLIETIHPDGGREQLQRNERGVVTRVVDTAGAEWTKGYDPRGNLTRTTDPMGGEIRFTHASNGAVKTVTDQVGATTTISTNRAGLPVSVTDALGFATTFEYDGHGRLIRSVDPLGGATTFAWTGDGKLSHRAGVDGEVEHWTWDGEGNLTSQVSPTGARSAVAYGIFDLPVARIGPEGGSMLFGYDTELRLTSVQNPAGLRWSYEYDAAGRLVCETDFNGRIQRYRHDAAGRLIAVINGLGEETTLTYNLAGDVVEKATVDGVTRMAYDAVGRLVRAASPGSVVELDRDACGRVVRETVNGRSVTFGYDPAGHRIHRLTPAGVLSQWAFDPVGRPRALRTAGQQVDFDFDPAGREVGRTFSSGGRLEQRFDGAHRLVHQAIGVVAQREAVGPVTARTMDYRADGVLAGMRDELTGWSRRFDLDRTGRVLGVRTTGWTENYVYDGSGNVTRFTGDADHGPGQVHYSGTLVTRARGVSYRHDRQGRVVARSRKRLSQRPETWFYRYDAEDRMIEAVCGTQRWVYAYDVFGRRISKQRVDGLGVVLERVLFTWDGDSLIEQTRIAATIGGQPVTTTWEYEPGTWRPVSQTVRAGAEDAEFYAVVSDLIGTPTELVTADGSRVAWSNDDATVWGAPRSSQMLDPLSKVGNGSSHASRYSEHEVHCPIRFPGQYADDETGLHYNRHRYYDPVAARYTTADPLGLAPADDPHSYVLNPTGWSDPLGLTPCGAAAGPGRATLDPADVRYSQTSVNHAAEIEESMRANGWVGGPIDVVRMPDGGLTTVDNTRVLAARRAGIRVEARIYDHSDAIAPQVAQRLKSRRKVLPDTWGAGILNRIGRQAAPYRNTYPSGSPIIGWNGC